jgi:hypothetical protein
MRNLLSAKSGRAILDFFVNIMVGLCLFVFALFCVTVVITSLLFLLWLAINMVKIAVIGIITLSYFLGREVLQ